jgi:hypothetical protein
MTPASGLTSMDGGGEGKDNSMSNSDDPRKPDLLTAHRMFRARMVQEDQLINYRTSWSIWTQGIFMALWGGLATLVTNTPCNHSHALMFDRLMYALCGVGFLFALGTLGSIIAALREMRGLIKQFGDNYLKDDEKQSPPPWLPSLIGAQWLHVFGHVLSIGGPGITIIVWVFLSLNVHHVVHHFCK